MLDFKLDVDAIDISKTAIELIKKEKKYKKVTFEELDMLEIDKRKSDIILYLIFSQVTP